MRDATTPHRRILLGILLLLVSLLTLASVLSSPPWPGAGPLAGLPVDACGEVGLLISRSLYARVGIPLATWGGLVAFTLAFRCLLRRPRSPWVFFLWSLPVMLLAALLGSRLQPDPRWGELAAGLADYLGSPALLGPLGSNLVLAGLLILLLAVGALRWIPYSVPRAVMEWAVSVVSRLRELAPKVPVSGGRRRADVGGTAGGKGRRAGRKRHTPSEPASMHPVIAARCGDADPGIFPPSEGDREAEPAMAATGSGNAPASGSSSSGSPASSLSSFFPSRGGSSSESDPEPGAGSHRPLASAGGAAPKSRTECGVYMLPPHDLLEEGERPEQVDREELLGTSSRLVQTLKDFGINGRVGQIHPGPVITQFEYEPAAGVRVAQIVSRVEDLALALRAQRIRLVAPIPGKGAVGVEVPNRLASIIRLRPLLEELESSGLAGELPMVFGLDVRGRPMSARLELMPHLLVAGTTGSGKSVFINCILLSLLLRKTPEEMRLLLIDPKMLELTPYDEIPHLVCPVVTEARVAARMLGWAVGEMERRYRRLAAIGVRNLEGYRKRAGTSQGKAEGLEPMPHIIIVVDELADLMLTLANEIEGPIARLAQMARAVGIHLVLATQRPSVDVITGVIKANFPARIAFQVASKVDSRTILDANGAESLLGRGDMLYLPPGKAQALRVHGAFVSEVETEAVVRFLRTQPPAPELVRPEEVSGDGINGSMMDDMFPDALRLVVVQQQASVSFLQRRLKVGYSRAGRLMDLLEQAGAVGQQDGSKTRQVLADESFLERWLNGEQSDG